MTKFVMVRLHGILGDQYGPEHRFAINSPREAINALDANFPGFRRDFLAVKHYGLLVDGDWRDEDTCPDVANAPIGRELDICPIIEGRIYAPILAGVQALVGTGVISTVIAGTITIGLSIAASLLLAPKPKKATSDAGTKNENYIFAGPENVTEQGVAVPLIYGRCFVGSVVISAGLEVAEDVTTSEGNNSWTWNRLAAAAGLLDMAFDDPAMARAALAQEPPEEPKESYPPGRTPRWWPSNA